MKTRSITLLLLLIFLFAFKDSFSQKIPKDCFSFKGPCLLEKVMSDYNDGKGNLMDVYQCRSTSPKRAYYRINVILFAKLITDKEQYIRSVYADYSKQGRVKMTTLKGLKAVQVEEDVVSDGVSLKQISVSILYKNRAITLVLTTDSYPYGDLLKILTDSFSLL